MPKTSFIVKSLGALIVSLVFFGVFAMLGSTLFNIGSPAAPVAKAEEPAAPVEAAAAPVEAAAVEAAAPAPAPVEAAPAQAAPVAVAAAPVAGDAAKGEKVFAKCKACHKIDGKDATGPHLNGVVGRASGSVAGFKYSDDMAALGKTWDAALLDIYLTKPKAMVPGTKMAFAGLPKAQDRADLIAFLATQQ